MLLRSGILKPLKRLVAGKPSAEMQQVTLEAGAWSNLLVGVSQ